MLTWVEKCRCATYIYFMDLSHIFINFSTYPTPFPHFHSPVNPNGCQISLKCIIVCSYDHLYYMNFTEDCLFYKFYKNIPVWLEFILIRVHFDTSPLWPEPVFTWTHCDPSAQTNPPTRFASTTYNYSFLPENQYTFTQNRYHF